ncbi:MAG TPA: sulfotransferase [Thermoanaerobaculia bacterium]|nr:sulfotransferase [Thermoanaerobaculia bacterium]
MPIKLPFRRRAIAPPKTPKTFVPADASAARPSFIMSCERAGSTLLRLLLDAHPQISCPDELFLGRLAAHLYDVVEATFQRPPNEDLADPVVLAEVRRIIGGLMATLARAEGKPIWCEKSPANWRNRGLLFRTFPDARFIVLHRHPLDVARSMLDALRGGSFMGGQEYLQRSPDNLLLACVEGWIEKTVALVGFENAHLDETIRVHYEALVAHPEETLRAILAFLGASELPDDLIERAFAKPRRQRAGHGDEKARYSTRLSVQSVGSGNSLRWRRLLEPEKIERLNEVMGYVRYPALDPDNPADYSVGLAIPRQEARVADLHDLFERYLPDQIARRPEVAREVPLLALEIDGADPLLLDASNADHPLGPLGAAQPAARIKIDSTSLLDIVNGKLNVISAQVLGKLRVQGPVAQLAPFARLLAATD